MYLIGGSKLVIRDAGEPATHCGLVQGVERTATMGFQP